jgi:hypothetical protein
MAVAVAGIVEVAVIVLQPGQYKLEGLPFSEAKLTSSEE